MRILLAAALLAGLTLSASAAKTVEAKTVEATITLPKGWTTQLGVPPYTHQTRMASLTASKTTITFGKGVTLMVNGKEQPSGYQVHENDKVEIIGGAATLTSVDANGNYENATLPAGTTLSVSASPANGMIQITAQLPATTTTSGTTQARQLEILTAQTSVLPPPSATQNIGVLPAS